VLDAEREADGSGLDRCEMICGVPVAAGGDAAAVFDPGKAFGAGALA
jgi:hypothetical protein